LAGRGHSRRIHATELGRDERCIAKCGSTLNGRKRADRNLSNETYTRRHRAYFGNGGLFAGADAPVEREDGERLVRGPTMASWQQLHPLHGDQRAGNVAGLDVRSTAYRQGTGLGRIAWAEYHARVFA